MCHVFSFSLGHSGHSLLNILSVCSAFVRKGLDYISSVVQRLGNSFMGMSWAKEISERVRAAKCYLKSDFKVRSSLGQVFKVIYKYILEFYHVNKLVSQ